MPTLYWTGAGNNQLDDDSSGNWLADDFVTVIDAPAMGDDLVFSASTPGYVGPAQTLNLATDLDSMIVGDILATDGSNCLDQGMLANHVYLSGGSSTGLLNDSNIGNGGTCTGLTAGADGSNCSFGGICTGDAQFRGSAANNGLIFGASTFSQSATNAISACKADFFDSTINTGITGLDGSHGNYHDAASDLGDDYTDANFYDNSIMNNGSLGGTCRGVTKMNDASSLTSFNGNTLVWNSTGAFNDSAAPVAFNLLKVQASLELDLAQNGLSGGTIELAGAGATLTLPAATALTAAVQLTIDTMNLSPQNIRAGEQILGIDGTASLSDSAGQYLVGASAGF